MFTNHTKLGLLLMIILCALLSRVVAQTSRTILDLQPWRHTESLSLTDNADLRAVSLTNLNPTINDWYVLQLSRRSTPEVTAYHLENVRPQQQTFHLDAAHPNGLLIVSSSQQDVCSLWGSTPASHLIAARRAPLPYVPLCDGKLYLRNPVKGQQSTLEATVAFLRDKIWGGDQVVTFVRDTFFKDAYRKTATLRADAASPPTHQPLDAPQAADLAPAYANQLVVPPDLGLSLQQPTPNGVLLGQWYAAQDNPGVYVSVIQPDVVAPEILQSFPARVKRLDAVEADALVYLVAFDLARFDLGFALGTEHPRVGWSEHTPAAMQDPSMPGPDGIGSVAPLVNTGMVPPYEAPRTVATFIGGFKRLHGVFKSGDLASRNHASHYGFIEHGVVFSKLQPGLATLLVFDDGRVAMRTWTEHDNALLQHIRHARQNGVPLVIVDPQTGTSAPGEWVNRWGAGNWSGSADKQLRTIRAGVCLQSPPSRQFLIYGYFSSATPSAMARVFQAYACQYAMLLDINALEHTYLALYRRQDANIRVQHLVQGMNVLDKTVDGQYLPRFLSMPDNRDFFYLMRRPTSKE